MSDTQSKKPVVLLVDDDDFLISMYTTKFQNVGFEVAAAGSASAALQKLRDGLMPDVLLVDIVMPAMDGIEFVKRVRAEKLAEKAACIFLTNQGQPSEIERAKEAGTDGYIVKASTIPSEVVAAVTRILSKKSK